MKMVKKIIIVVVVLIIAFITVYFIQKTGQD
jgi:hypothetical protein